MNQPRKIRLLLFGFAAVALTVFALALLVHQAAILRSSPTAPRNSTDYDRAMHPLKAVLLTNALPPIPVTITNVGTSFQISHPSVLPKDTPTLNLVALPVPANQILNVDGGTVLLRSIQIAYGKPQGATNGSRGYLDTRFFHADLKPYSTVELEKEFPHQWQRQTTINSELIEAAYDIETRGLNSNLCLNAALFDTRTHHKLADRHITRNVKKGEYQVAFDVPMYHPGPVTLVVDLTFGPAQNFDIAPKAGQVIRLPYSEYQLLAATWSPLDYWSTSTGSSNSTVSFYKAPVDDNKGSVFVFCGRPNIQPLPLELDFLDARGESLIKPAASGIRGSSAEHVIGGVKAPLSEVAQVRVQYYPNGRRFIFNMAEIPGLPEVNRNTDNLFAVKIPYVQMNRSYDFLNTVKSVTQLNFSGSVPNPVVVFPPGYFPRTFENITSTELMEEYLRHCPQNYTVRVDQSRGELIIEPSQLEKIKGKFLKVWHKVF